MNFFGLSLETAPQTRKNLFKQIHEIVFHGKGGYDWETVYHMPIWLRNYTFHELKTFYNKTGCPFLLNTSFNLAGEALVDSPTDAINTYENSNIDVIWFPETETMLCKEGEK